MYVLGIESTCDETAAAIVEDGRKVISNVISTSVKEQALYGGVVPEIASRRHAEYISATVDKALADAGMTMADVDAVAGTFAPGLIGALLSGIVAAKLTRIPYLTLADLGCIAAPIGLFFGRCANFVNGELWGAPTDGPLGVVFGGAAGMMPRHPSQLYEAVLEGLVIFCVLFALSRKRPPRPQGTFLGAFLVLYGIFRFLIEFVREPDVQLGYLWGGWLTMGQVLSAPLIVAGIALLIWAARTRHPQVGPQEIQPPSVPGEAA